KKQDKELTEQQKQQKEDKKNKKRKKKKQREKRKKKKKEQKEKKKKNENKQKEKKQKKEKNKQWTNMHNAFSKNATPLQFVIGTQPVTLNPMKLSKGKYGWKSNGKMKVMLAGKQVMANYHVQGIVQSVRKATANDTAPTASEMLIMLEKGQGMNILSDNTTNNNILDITSSTANASASVDVSRLGVEARTKVGPILRKKSPLTHLQLYIRDLICNRDRSKEQVLEKLHKMPWFDYDTRSFILASLLDVRHLSNELNHSHTYKYMHVYTYIFIYIYIYLAYVQTTYVKMLVSRIEFLAEICGDLNDYYNISFELAEALIEQIQLNDESNSCNSTLQLNCIKYLVELYVHRAINIDSVVNTLFWTTESSVKRFQQGDRLPINSLCEFLNTCSKYIYRGDTDDKASRCHLFVSSIKRQFSLMERLAKALVYLDSINCGDLHFEKKIDMALEPFCTKKLSELKQEAMAKQNHHVASCHRLKREKIKSEHEKKAKERDAKKQFNTQYSKNTKFTSSDSVLLRTALKPSSEIAAELHASQNPIHSKDKSTLSNASAYSLQGFSLYPTDGDDSQKPTPYFVYLPTDPQPNS
ncbi:hypothetical protein RFI_23717, partial [Reticulomyxa filosa]